MSGTELLSAVQSGLEYKYIFLDIEMPELSGFDIYAKLESLCDVSIIFVSTHIKLLPEVFSLRPHGFLAKPYDQDVFDRTVKSAMEQNNEAGFFQFFRDGAEETIPCSSILYFTISDYILKVYDRDGDSTILSRKRLDEVELELFKFGFFRCNRSTLVNLRYCSGRKAGQIIIKHTSASMEL